MAKRAIYLKALRRESTDRLVWAPNFDYWLGVSSAEGTIPAKFAGMSRNDIVRAIDAYIWNRTNAVRGILDDSVKESWLDDGGRRIHIFDTPVGSVSEVYIQSEGAYRTRFLSEHFVKDLESLKVMRYIAEATHYEPVYDITQKALDETGNDGIVLVSGFCVPFIRFTKMDAGYINGFYMWADHKKEVDALVDAYFKSYLEGCRIAAGSPADVIAFDDNMDGLTMPPDLFKEYAVPYYQAVREFAEPQGKLLEGHWCGRTQSLLPYVPNCGLDIVEAIVTQPMAEIRLNDALDILDERVTLQGGIPSVLLCEEGCSRDDFRKYIDDVIVPLKGGKGFVLGLSDNTPPNADFYRLEMIADLIR